MVNQEYYPLTNIQKKQEVLCVENLFTLEELSRICSLCDSLPKFKAQVGEDNSEIVDSIRKCNINFLYGEEYNWIYDRLCTAIKYVNSINFNKILYGIEPLQYSEYDSTYDGFYGIHVDANPDTQYALKRSLSFSLQLSQETSYTGGELKIYYKTETICANKTYGVITVFDSSYPHEITQVTSGLRKSLVGWVLGPRV